jgi:sulfate transport system substrate-binding protein
LPDNSSPYTSTIVFLVRKGNPKAIKDWGDLIKDGVQVVTPNPKTSGGARWNFLAAWGYAAGAKGRDFSKAGEAQAAADAAKAAKDFPIAADEKGKAFVTELFKHVAVLDTGARGSTISFAQKGIGDVLLAWENEAWLAQQEFGKDKFEIVYPSISILAEPPVTIVDKFADEHNVRPVAEAYLKFLYTKPAQETIGLLHYRPRDTEVLAKHKATLPPIPLFTVDETFGGWDKAQRQFFGTDGVFDQISKPAK